MVRKVWEKIKSFFKWLLKQLKDKTNLAIFAIVFLVMSCEIWIPYIIAIITGDEWWWAVGSACWAFWALPITPFLPICIAVTIGIRKIVDKVRDKRNKK